MKKLTEEDFINKSNIVHNGKYDYSKVNYKGMNEKVLIYCKDCGSYFEQTPKNHIKGHGCPICARKGNNEYYKKIKNEKSLEFIKKAKTIFPEYDFSNSVYKGCSEKVEVVCPVHGKFSITPNHLLRGEGCPKCRYIKSGEKNRNSLSDLISQAEKVHNGKYDYSLITEYKNNKEKYPIICPVHGTFYQSFNNHINGGQGCPKCASENRICCSNENFIRKAKLVHGDKYDYSKTKYERSDGKVTITCKIHGDFEQIARNHLMGTDCPKCHSNISKGEEEIYLFLKELLGNEEIIRNDRNVLDGMEIDLLVPKYGIGIEYDGLFWYSLENGKSPNYHLLKTINAEKKGIRLIHIYEDEWNEKKDILKSMLTSIFHKSDKSIYGRKCVVKEVPYKEYVSFLEKNHIQGRCVGKVAIGLYYEEKLISLSLYGHSRHFAGNGKCEWELLRMCSERYVTVVGGAGKMLSFFIKTYHPKEILTFADRRWSVGNVYNELGFEKYNESKPSYYYVVGNHRIYRYSLRKSVLVKKYGCLEEMTEKEFCHNQGWYRIYDCGCLCYKLKLDKND